MPQDLFEKLLVVLSALWKNRNDMLWQNKSKPHTDIVLGALSWLQEFHVVRKTVGARTVKKKLKWKPAEDGYCKLNVDGSYLPQKTNGVGGVVRNSQGQFMAAFAKPMLFMALVKQVELSAIKEGLLLVKSMQLKNVLVETDCSEAVSAIRAIQHETMEEAGLIDDIKELMKSLSGVSISHTPRSCNGVAHRLAAVAYEDRNSGIWFCRPPNFICDALIFDCSQAD